MVPVYGGESTLETLVKRLREVLESRGVRYEIIFVCDAPIDGSWPLVRRLAKQYPEEVRGYLLRRNFGQHAALLLGVRAALGRTIVTMDEDLEHNPNDVPALVEASERHGAIVYGVPVRMQHGWFRNQSSRFVKWFLAQYLGVEDAQDLSAFRAFPQDLREAFRAYGSEMVAVDVLLSWAGAPVRSMLCEFESRQGGRSGYTFRKLVAHLGNLAFGFSVAPLRAASYLGFISLVLAILIGGYVLTNWFISGSAVPGFAFLALTISAFAGAQLMVLGIMGEYLGRLYIDGLKRPQYLISDFVGAVDTVCNVEPEQLVSKGFAETVGPDVETI